MPLLFVTAKLPLDRVNAFLSEHQSLRDIAPNSIVSLVRNQSTSVMDVDESTEPPVGQFESGFVDAKDEDLWKSLGRLAQEDDEIFRAISINRDMLFALDEMSKSKDTVAVLWSRSRYGELYKWRVEFRFVPLVIADLLDQRDKVDEVYIRSDMKREDGTLDMKKIKEALGGSWLYG